MKHFHMFFLHSLLQTKRRWSARTGMSQCKAQPVLVLDSQATSPLQTLRKSGGPPQAQGLERAREQEDEDSKCPPPPPGNRSPPPAPRFSASPATECLPNAPPRIVDAELLLPTTLPPSTKQPEGQHHAYRWEGKRRAGAVEPDLAAHGVVRLGDGAALEVCNGGLGAEAEAAHTA